MHEGKKQKGNELVQTACILQLLKEVNKSHSLTKNQLVDNPDPITVTNLRQ